MEMMSILIWKNVNAYIRKREGMESLLSKLGDVATVGYKRQSGKGKVLQGPMVKLVKSLRPHLGYSLMPFKTLDLMNECHSQRGPDDLALP